MIATLVNAPFDTPLVLTRVVNPHLALRLRRIGLFEGSEIVRLDEEVLVQPVRVRGPKGEVVLSGGMALKTIVHMEDGRKLPIAEMEREEAGHIEGLIGGQGLTKALEVLGLKINDHVTCLRRLPSMEYMVLIKGVGRVRLTEGMATKIWGRMQDRLLQFISTRAREEFHVLELLGGDRATAMLHSRGIEPGTVITLEGVAPAQSLEEGFHNPVIISSREGLRLFLDPQASQRIYVREAGAEA